MVALIRMRLFPFASGRRSRRVGLFAVLLLTAALLAHWLDTRLVAAALFLRMEDPKGAPGWLLHYAEHAVARAPFALPSGEPALLYRPQGAARKVGLVLAHGVHEAGMHEPRLVRFARALASTGLTVLTPELADLTRYRVTHASAERIAAAARALAEHLGRPRVAVFGVSFGGGLALRAACEPALRGAISHVIGLGAHHDASVVARFFLGEAPRTPEGEVVALEPHNYGARVMFAWFFGEAHRGTLSAADRERLRAALRSHEKALDEASPAHCPEPPSVPVHLVHGLGDRIVPYTETLWNARQFAASTDVSVLVSPVVAHAEYAPPTLLQRLSLVAFMADALP